ncbi:MAG: hypothetical protein AAGF93_05460 [Cyanobacteria bacterium P01_H01_bin.105]
METIEWHELLGNVFLTCPSKAMITDDGDTVVKKCGIKGDSKFKESHEVRVIHYGRDYVVAWLAKRFFSNFKGIKWNELQPILSEAYKKARKEDK